MGYKVTVEPVVFLHMLGVYMILPALQDLIYTKVCMNKYTPDVCANLYDPTNENALSSVEASSSHWILGSTLTLSLPSIFSAQFLGSWSDTFGSKIPMLIPQIGGVLSSLVYIGLSVYIHQWSLSLVLLASLFMGITGSFSSCILTCMSYMCQISSVSSRTWRLSLLEAMIFAGAFVGPALSGWLQINIGRPFLFLIVMCFFVVNVLHILLFITNIEPRHASEHSKLKESLNCKHSYSSLLCAVKNRPLKRRNLILLLLLVATIVLICTMGEVGITYIYVRDVPLQWNISLFSKYLSFKSLLGGAALILIRLCSELPDAGIMVFGIASKAAGLLLLGLATTSTGVFSSAVLASASTWVLPVIRSSLSKLVEVDEQGKILACVALVENASSLIASALYNSLYPVTRELFGGFLFVVSAGSLLIAIGLTIFAWRGLKLLDIYDEIQVDDEERTVGTDPDPNPNHVSDDSLYSQ